MDTPRLTHVRVNVRDLSTAVGWYERLLGVAADGHWPPDEPTYAHFTLGPTQYALGQYEPAPSTGARFNFEVENVDAWWARVGRDADVVEPLFDTPYGTRKFTIRDPDGNELGFVQAQMTHSGDAVGRVLWARHSDTKAALPDRYPDGTGELARLWQAQARWA